jgi:iron(III) transport system substrate-binding protein
MNILKTTGFLLAAGAGLSLHLGSTVALAGESFDQILAGAKKEGTVKFFESQPTKIWVKIMKPFQEKYPFIKSFQHQRMFGGKLNTKIITDAQAGVDSADLMSSSPVAISALLKRGLLQKVDWAGIGISKKSIYDEYSTLSSVFFYAIGYNTNLVKGTDIPKNWEDILNPKWADNGGWWRYSQPWPLLAKDWGQAKAEKFLKRMLASKLRTARSPTTIANWLSAGEVRVGLTVTTRLQQAHQRGAPVAWVYPEPLPVTQLVFGVIKGAKHPNAAKLLVHWLSSPEGGLIYEKMTFRGNPYIKGSEMAKVMASHKTVFYSRDRIGDFKKSSKAMSKILKAAKK